MMKKIGLIYKISEDNIKANEYLEETKKVMKKVNAEDFLYVIIQYDSCKF
jgi:hypothetical protein